MRKIMLIVLTVAVASVAYAQDQKDINEQVWKPFTKAIMEQDVEGFASLHSPDLVRAELDDNRLLSLAEYKERMEKGWPVWKESIRKNKITYTFELRFTQRISNGKVALETGYFKNETVNEKGEARKSYGKFHVVLRKENGEWKILVDSDTNENGTITEEKFLAAQPLES